ncbi:hypothetical protein GCM10007063_22600 [Lentibacillus kapialis]|uniref:DksA C4-type domain-containing protein n=1 Tax=Lentibacillus kapialis TaxID=340214 RepID=A0A917PY14_9BACI|nr:hypothetical protein [Lentibacillus kapialis]GGJ99708.1 hypothetical protein GCM10007063_22600 [Lentibacillus kapialis]
MLNEEKQEHFKNLLLEMKNELELKMKTEDESGPNDATGDLADYDNHPGDMGTEQFEQEKEAGMNRARSEHLDEIKSALERIENGTFGISEKSGKPIPEERLKAEPTARYRVDEQ